MARLIGTAGHVDHGKTSLIRALTGIDADRLPEEKSRGMTIDLGFAHINLPGVGQTSIVDVPGHERFLANMLVGALGVDIALLCVAADEGPKPQTIEHLAILNLLPIERIIVALTRADLADDDTRELSEAFVRELLTSTRFAQAPIHAVSAVTGEGIEQLREALAKELTLKSTAKPGNWYIPVDRSFVVKGQGVVITGTLMQGSLHEGEQAELQPQALPVKVRGIQRHDHSESAAEFGMRTAVRLGGVELAQVARGCILAQPGTAFRTDCLDLQVRWLETPKHNSRIRLSIGADEVIGRLILQDEATDWAQVRLSRETAAVSGQPFILRSYSPAHILGGGRVRVVQAERRRSKGEQNSVELDDSIENQVVGVISNQPKGMKTEDVCRVLGTTPQQLGDVFEHLIQHGSLLGFAGLWFTPDHFLATTETLEQALLEWHSKNPTEAGAPRDIVLREARLGWAEKPLARILSHLQSEGKVRIEGNKIAHADFAIQLNARQESLLQRVEAALDSGGFSVPGTRALAQELKVPPQAIEEILKIGVQAKRLVRVGDDLHYTMRQLLDIEARVREFDHPFSATEFKDLLNTSRKYAIPLLELSDARGWTQRQGDVRVVVARNVRGESK